MTLTEKTGATPPRQPRPPGTPAQAGATVIKDAPAMQEVSGIGLVPDVTKHEEVCAIIARLGKKRLLTWKLETPTTPHPERHLRRFLHRLGDQKLASVAWRAHVMDSTRAGDLE